MYPKSIRLVIDRVILKEDEDFYNRLADAIQMAFYEGKGTLFIEHLESNKISEFNNRFERDGITFTEPNVHLFSFNNPFGACPTCEGYGDVVGVDQDLVIPNTSLSIYENAIFPWRGDSMGWYRDQLVNSAYKFDFPIHKPWFELTKTQQQLVWDGNEHFEGLHSFFKYLESKSYKIQNRVMLSRFKAYDDIRSLFAKQKLSDIRGYKTKHFSFNVDGGRCDTCKGEGEITIEMQFMADVNLQCDVCNGKRFKKEVLEVKVGDKNIDDILTLTVDDAIEFFKAQEQKRIVTKLQPLQDVGLGYVKLGQSSSTLSGGEAQRIKLASFLVKGITKEKTLFIFDEPTTGLHFHDIKKLLASFYALLEKGHTLIVVEHNIDLIKCADYIIDLGLEGGSKGGQIMVQGTPEVVSAHKKSYTAKYLKEKI